MVRWHGPGQVIVIEAYRLFRNVKGSRRYQSSLCLLRGVSTSRPGVNRLGEEAAWEAGRWTEEELPSERKPVEIDMQPVESHYSDAVPID